jgi:hypothetical protein
MSKVQGSLSENQAMSNEQETRRSIFTSKQVRTNIYVAVFSAIATLIVPIYLSDTLLLQYKGLIIGLVVAAIGATSVLITVEALRQTLEASNKDAENWSTLAKVPSLVTFVERTEKITVTDTGDGIFESLHRVEYNPDHNRTIDRLHFPVIIDLPEKMEPPGCNIQVESIIVDGEELPTDAYAAKEIRRAYESNPDGQKIPQEYGIVTVPVALNEQRRQAIVNLKIKYKSIFKNRSSKDYVIVDIPYVTKHLAVRICAENTQLEVRGPIGKQIIDATCEMMDLTDSTEENYQLSNISNGPKDIQWTTRSAKIGYRYKLWFRVVDPKARIQV